MAIVHYTAKATDSRTLELPEEAQSLGLEPGDEVEVTMNDRVPSVSCPAISNEEAIAIIRQISAHHKDHRITDSSITQVLLREARGGAAYGYEPTE